MYIFIHGWYFPCFCPKPRRFVEEIPMILDLTDSPGESPSSWCGLVGTQPMLGFLKSKKAPQKEKYHSSKRFFSGCMENRCYSCKFWEKVWATLHLFLHVNTVYTPKMPCMRVVKEGPCHQSNGIVTCSLLAMQKDMCDRVINSHCFHIIGDGKINPIVGVYRAHYKDSY